MYVMLDSCNVLFEFMWIPHCPHIQPHLAHRHSSCHGEAARYLEARAPVSYRRAERQCGERPQGASQHPLTPA